MKADEIKAYCLEKKDSYIDHPFGPIPTCLKVHGHIFAQIYPNVPDHKLTLKCEPSFGDFYRQLYPGTVARGYHCPPVQQPYWNTIYLNGTVPDETLKLMIDHAYKAVVAKLPRKMKLL